MKCAESRKNRHKKRTCLLPRNITDIVAKKIFAKSNAVNVFCNRVAGSVTFKNILHLDKSGKTAETHKLTPHFNKAVKTFIEEDSVLFFGKNSESFRLTDYNTDREKLADINGCPC